MLLPFVRELFADVEMLPAFTRVASHLREGTGRIRVSGLSPTAKALLLVLLRRHADRPLILVVNDNRAVEDFVPILRGFCELTAACDPEAPSSPCPPATCSRSRISLRIPNCRKSAPPPSGKSPPAKASILVTPVAATAILLRSADYYTDLARILRRGESFDVETSSPT
jgi:transcription-repair coupling factor (superfamily II helicase)